MCILWRSWLKVFNCLSWVEMKGSTKFSSTFMKSSSRLSSSVPSSLVLYFASCTGCKEVTLGWGLSNLDAIGDAFGLYLLSEEKRMFSSSSSSLEEDEDPIRSTSSWYLADMTPCDGCSGPRSTTFGRNPYISSTCVLPRSLWVTSSILSCIIFWEYIKPEGSPRWRSRIYYLFDDIVDV